ncbi:MAG: hypothetical protein ACYC2P_01810 [Paludibacteraceae bacterium]
MRNKSIIIVVLVLLLIGCNKFEKKYYYPSGKVMTVIQLIDASEGKYYSKFYDESGCLIIEGFVDSEGIPNGFRKEYYKDGRLKWRGNVDSLGIVLPDSIWGNMQNYFSAIEIKNHPTTLLVNHEYDLRTYVEGIHPDVYLVTDSNYNKLPKSNDENFSYKFTPLKEGNIKIYLIFPDSNGNIISGRDMKIYKYKVAK